MSGVVAYINRLKERQGIGQPTGMPHEDCSLLMDVDVLDALARIALAAHQHRSHTDLVLRKVAGDYLDDMLLELSRVVDQRSRM